MEFFFALAENPLLRSALLGALFASFASGIVGTYVVAKRIVFLAGSIAHAVLGGIGLSLWLSRTHGITFLSPMSGALLFALLSAWLMGWIHLYHKEREDTVIASLWSIGMAIGILFMAITPGTNLELSNYLVGNVLWTTTADLIILAGLDLIILLVAFKYHKKFVALCFDEEGTRLQGLSILGLYLLLLSLTAITVVLLLESVGIILVMTMLAIPPAIANFFSARMSTMMVIAVILSFAFNFSGHLIAYNYDMPIGATSALTTALFYLIALPFLRKIR